MAQTLASPRVTLYAVRLRRTNRVLHLMGSPEAKEYESPAGRQAIGHTLIEQRRLLF